MSADLPIAPDSEVEETALLVRRLRVGALMCIAAIAGFALLDLVLARQQLGLLYGLKLVAGLVAIGSYAALPRVRGRRQIIAVGLVCGAGMYALSASSAVIIGDPATTSVVALGAVLATATLLPWGVGPQVIVVVMSMLASVIAVIGARGSFGPLLAYTSLGLLIGVGVSIYVATELQRSRTLLARRHAEQRRAEAEVRRLNEHLEARVAARTAELEQVTRALRMQITQRAEAETEARRSEAALTALIEYANDAIWSIDPSHRVTALNAVARQEFAAMFGARPAADRRAFIDRHWRPLYERGLAGERFTIEHSFPMPDGMRHYRTFFNPIVSDGTVGGLAIFSADITERLRAEEAAREHRAELTHVLRLSTMGEMAAGLAHEINQPLAAIVNYAQGCSRRLRADVADVRAVVPVIDDITAEALRAGEIIRRLRKLVRKEPPRQEWIKLADVAAEALRLVEPDTHQQAIAVRVEADPELPPALGDPIQMEQVVLNLLRNAIEAMAEVRGRRELSVRIARAGTDAIELTVRDTGHGLIPAVAERLFDPFFSTKPSGLGMGLSISRSIVEAHLGRLVAAGNPDGGATFRITLPAASGAATAAAAG